MWQVRLVDAVTKVLPGHEPPPLTSALSGLFGERVSFQVALLPPPTANSAPADTVTVSVTAGSRLSSSSADVGHGWRRTWHVGGVGSA